MSINFHKISGLSRSSANLYENRWNKLLEMFGDISEILFRPYHVYHQLRNKYKNWYTINGFIVPVYTILKKMPDIAGQVPEGRLENWNKISDYCKTRCQMLKIGNKDTKNVGLTYNDLLDKLDSLEGKDKLLLAMYTLIPPVRRDYGNLKIVRRDIDYQNESGSNLIYLNDDRSNCFIELSEYKTRTSYGKVKCELPDNLVKIIDENIGESDNYLFTMQNGECYSKSSFGEFVRNRLWSIFGKKMSINSLRHIYITGNIKLGMDSKERILTAKKMGHSTDTQVKYMWTET